MSQKSGWKSGKKHQRNPAAGSKGSVDPSDSDPPSRPNLPPPVNYVFNYAPPLLPMPNVYPNTSTYNPNVFPNPQQYPYVHRDVAAENYELKARIQSLENAFQKLGKDSQNVTPTLSEAPKQSKKPNAESKNSPTQSKSSKKKSCASLETNKTGREGNGGGNVPLKGQQNPKVWGAQNRIDPKHQQNPPQNKKDQERSAKSPGKTVAKNIDPEKEGKGGGKGPWKGPWKGQHNPKDKPQQNASEEPFNRSDLSATAGSLPKGQPQLVRKVPSQEKKDDGKFKVWDLHVVIEADIDITQKLPNYLDERLKHKIKFEVKSVTKDKTTGFVRFLLRFKSKHEMTMAMRSFHSSNEKDIIKLHCKPIVEGKALQDSPSTMGNELKSQNAIVQQKHEKKIENVRQEITSVMASVGGTFALQESNSNRVKALEYKEKELLSQWVEYKNAHKDLEMQLETLQQDQKEDSVEGEKVVKKLGQEMKFLSKALPIYAKRTKIAETVLRNKVTILMGNCGSGKSTQLVQYLMETSLVEDGPIVCTEPSEMRALSLAKYVARGVNSSLGNLVGFSSGKDIQLSIRTSVLFMSEHELLAQFQKMKSFNAYSCIVVDEVQERTVYTDVLLGLLKLELSKIPRLRIVILTAPSEIGIYESFFADSVSIELNSCSFPVEVIWKKTDDEDNILHRLLPHLVEKAIWIHALEDEGDILVFVATDAEAIECSRDLNSCLQNNNYLCLPLHGELDCDQLNAVYRPSPPGKRKIVFATSCAEVLNAVPNVRYVIDSGRKKGRFLESVNKNEPPISFISQESARRRKERAGSSFAGKCYRLYSPDDIKGMKATEPDEMSLAGSIEKAVLNLIELEIDPMKFQFPVKVPEEKISRALRNLYVLGAAFDCGTFYLLTDLGTEIFNLPFEFQIIWMLLEGIKQGIVMHSIALAILSDFKQDVFLDAQCNERILTKQQAFGLPRESKALRTIRVLAAWFQQPKKEKDSWGAENFLDVRSIKLIISQMRDLCKTLETDIELGLNEKFDPTKLTSDTNDLQKLIDRELAKFTSSVEELNLITL